MRDVSLRSRRARCSWWPARRAAARARCIRAINGLDPARLTGELTGTRARRWPGRRRETACARSRDRRHAAPGPGASRSSGRPWKPSWHSARRTSACRADEIRDRIEEVDRGDRIEHLARAGRRACSPAASASCSRWRARSCCGRAATSSTSRSPTSIRPPPSGCSACSASWPMRATRWSSSSTGSRRRCAAAGPRAGARRRPCHGTSDRRRIPRGRRSGARQAAVRGRASRGARREPREPTGGPRRATSPAGTPPTTRPRSTRVPRRRWPARRPPVLRGVSAALAARETVAVLGPNGSGKTTLFRAAMQLVPPDAGRVLVDGASMRPGPRSPSWRATSATSSRARARCCSRAPSARNSSSGRGTSASTRRASMTFAHRDAARVGLADEEGSSIAPRSPSASASRNGWRWPSRWPSDRGR